MCELTIINDLEMVLEIEDGSIWLYESNGDFIADFKINFCPICGEKFI